MSYQFKIEDLNNFDKLLKELLDNNISQLNKLLKIKQKTYNNFCVPYQLLNEKLHIFITPLSHINSVNNSPQTQKIYRQCLPLLSNYYTQLGQNEEFFDAIRYIKSNEQKSLNDEQNRVLNNVIRDFKLSGCGLPKESKARLKVLNLKSSQLEEEFSQNLLDATNSWEMICDIDDLKEMPQSDLNSAKFEDDNGKIRYKFTLQIPSYTAYITYGNNRVKREEIYKAYCTRAPKNESIINNLIGIKYEMANILGFENYAQYSIESKMAKTQDDVLEFLETLASISKNKAKKELEDVKALALNLDNIIDFQVYDMAYYSEKLKNEQYNIDEEFYKSYFEQDSVVDGLFEFLYKFFDIQFVQIQEESWDKKVKIFHIVQNGNIIGKIFFDLEARKNKNSGAWMHNWHNRYQLNDKEQIPTAFVVCNFTPSSKENKSLLRHNDVVTLFHEMGHALHHLLTSVKEPFVSGINGVVWDTVEFPSQFLEYFTYEKDVLKIFAKHYKTKEILSNEDINKLIKAKNFQSALATIRQVEFALFDFKLYQNKGDVDVQNLLDTIRKQYSVLIPPVYNKFQNGFSHIFAGGYSAGYYSYKWAEVLSADAFYLFKENGIFNKKLSLKYKDIILAMGGSKDMNELYLQFASRQPKIESLLKIDGIIS